MQSKRSSVVSAKMFSNSCPWSSPLKRRNCWLSSWKTVWV